MPSSSQSRKAPISERSPVLRPSISPYQKLEVKTFGGPGGNAFEISPFRTLRLWTGSMVDRISISGESHGGRGGERSPQLILQKEEYIERIEIRSGSQIDFVKFTTNLGQSIGGGGDGGDLCLLENIRLLGIAGRSGSTLDGLTFFFEEL